VPVACPNVPSEILDPRRTWPDAAAYDRKAAELAGMFVRNFQENAADAPSEIAAAGPKV
jgi:phosphoenolpyruvate carboxykinase (ATP)